MTPTRQPSENHDIGPGTLGRLNDKANKLISSCAEHTSKTIVPTEKIAASMRSFVDGTSVVLQNKPKEKPKNWIKALFQGVKKSSSAELTRSPAIKIDSKTKPKNRIQALFQAIKKSNDPKLLEIFEKTFNVKDMSTTFTTVDLNKKGATQEVRDIDHEQTMACFRTPTPVKLEDGSFRIGAHFTDAKGVERAQQGAELQQNLMLAYALTGTHEGPTSTHFMHGDRCTIIASNDGSNPDTHKELLRTLGVDKASFNEALGLREISVGPVTLSTPISSHGFEIHDGTLSVENLNYYDFLSEKEGNNLTLAEQLHFHLTTSETPVINKDGKVLIKDEEQLTSAVRSFRDFKRNGLNEAQIKLVVKTIMYQGQEGVPIETKGVNHGDHQLMGEIAVGGTGNMVIDGNGVAQTIRPDGTNGSLCIVAKENMEGANGMRYAAVAFGIEGANPLKTNMHTGALHLKTGRHDVKAGKQFGSETMALADTSFVAGLGSKEVTLNAQELKALTEKMDLLKEARETHPKLYQDFADKLLSATTPEARDTLYNSFEQKYIQAVENQATA